MMQTECSAAEWVYYFINTGNYKIMSTSESATLSPKVNYINVYTGISLHIHIGCLKLLGVLYNIQG
jgi:hypothetical protein